MQTYVVDGLVDWCQLWRSYWTTTSWQVLEINQGEIFYVVAVLDK